MKRIVTIQDISCVGKCSLTVALPVISACGVETAVLPTAVLSTHTAFNDFTFKDLTDEIVPIVNHWKRKDIKFDAIYTGYLGSFRQLDLINGFFDDFKTTDNIVFVDPVMGDNGKLYPGFTQSFADNMAKLCSKANVIVPNITEACYMLHRDYMDNNYSESDIKKTLKSLAELGADNSVITGVSFEKDKVGFMCYSSEKNEYFKYFTERINKSFHGTGDVFSSACVGSLMNSLALDEALITATDFTVKAINKTIEDNNHNWYGVNFEYAIPDLIEALKLKKEN